MYEKFGGETRLRVVIDVFIERVVRDVMIGYMFKRVNITRLKEMEFQHAARFLGANTAYTGQPLQKVHSPHRITGGHFSRRKKILEDVLIEQGVSDEIMAAWLEHVEQLRPIIMDRTRPDCLGGNET